MKKWKTLKSKYILKNPWLNVRQDKCQMPNGKEIDNFFVLERPDWILVFPVTKNKEVILVKQYKHGIGKIILELPAGGVDESDRSTLAAAKRELREETGYSGGAWSKEGEWIHEPSGQTNKITFYIAKNVKKKFKQSFDITEDIEVIKVPIKSMRRMIEKGEIKTQGHIAAILIALEKIKF